MSDTNLFKEYYIPNLLAEDISNIVLRKYFHVKGVQADAPLDSTTLIFTPLSESATRVTRLAPQDDGAHGIALTSIISIGSEVKQLFLLDCGIPISCTNEVELLQLLDASRGIFPALKKGMLLRTKNSYHVVGFTPLSKEEWLKHMTSAIILCTKSGASVADARYVARSLARGYGSLRISSYEDKIEPEFVRYL